MSGLIIPKSALDIVAVSVHFEGAKLRVLLSDGREILAPLDWFPRLESATPKQRENWRLVGRGVGIRWEDIDEDLSVEGLLVY